MSDVDSAQKVYKTYLMVDNFIEILMENEKSGANDAYSAKTEHSLRMSGALFR